MIKPIPLDSAWWRELRKTRRMARHVEPLILALKDLLTGPPLEGLAGGRITRAQEAIANAEKDR